MPPKLRATKLTAPVPVDGVPVGGVPVDGVPVDGSLTGIVQTWGLVKPEFSGESWKDLVICTAL